MIGRKKEIDILTKLYRSNKPEFVAIYGRIRVGKTYLVSQIFNNRFTFTHAGLSPIENEELKPTQILNNQLKQFFVSLKLYGYEGEEQPKTWIDAFYMLATILNKKNNGEKQVVFIDELPWLDTKGSNFITAFEGFWNNYCCFHNNILLIVCGSATSWITNNLINNHGGLYNRLTYSLKLSAFALKECKQFFIENGVKFSDYDIVRSYMCVGGIPYYLSYFENGLSLSQNIDKLFFSKNAILSNEYDKLFNSIFQNSNLVKKIIEFIQEKKSGFTRDEILKHLGKESSGSFSDVLNSIVECGLITKYFPFGLSKREPHYKLIDPFCLFYLHFKNNFQAFKKIVESPSYTTWEGNAFENVCFNHIDQIKNSLGIASVESNESLFYKKGNEQENGTQIDLIIERKDNITNICEIKFLSNNFTVDKDYHRTIVTRNNIVKDLLPKKRTIYSTLITTYGLTYNEYSGDYDNVVLIDDLFS